MMKYLIIFLSLFSIESFANDRRADCIKAIIREAPPRAGRTFSYLEGHMALVENIGGTQWLYVDHGGAYTDHAGEFFACEQVEQGGDYPRDLNIKALSLFEENYASSRNPRQYLNALLAPCRRSGMDDLVNRLNSISDSGSTRGVRGEALDGDGG